MRRIRDRWAEISEKTMLLGVSGGSGESHLRFIEKERLPFPLIHDVEGKISEAYGVRKIFKILGFKFPLIKRVTFLIDEDGKVSHMIKKVKIGRHVDDILDLLT